MQTTNRVTLAHAQEMTSSLATQTPAAMVGNSKLSINVARGQGSAQTISSSTVQYIQNSRCGFLVTEFIDLVTSYCPNQPTEVRPPGADSVFTYKNVSNSNQGNILYLLNTVCDSMPFRELRGTLQHSLVTLASR